MAPTLVKINGTSSVHDGGETARGLWDYDRRVSPSEVIEGVPVRDWPDGVHELKELPPEPKEQQG